MSIAKIERRNGVPTLLINGIPKPVLGFAGSVDVLATYAKATRDVDIFFPLLDLGWVGSNQYNYEDFDQAVVKILEGNPNAYLIPQINCNSLEWWNDLYPKELTLYHDGGTDKNAKASYASRLWRKETEAALERLIQHIRNREYNNQIIGYYICVGYTGEWNRFRAQDGFSWDYSVPMHNEFRKWLKDQYKGNSKLLKTAWSDDAISFSTATVPTRDEEMRTDLYNFRDPSVSRNMIDYFIFRSNLVADVILEFCACVKSATGNESVTGVSFGYVADDFAGGMWTDEGFSSMGKKMIQSWGHQALRKVVSSPHVDFILSFYAETYRGVGGDATTYAPAETVLLHNKLHITEDDTRTFLSTNERLGKSETLEDTIAVLKRNFSQAFITGSGYLMGNQGSNTWWPVKKESEWYNHPDLFNVIEKMKKIGDRGMDLDRSSSSEIAVIIDETTPAYENVNVNLTYPLFHKQKQYELGRIGSPYAMHIQNDLIHNNFPEYKCYIFLNTFYLSSEDRKRISEKVQRNGNVVVWIYAPGLINEDGISAESMSELTKIRLNYIPEQWGLNIAISNFDHPITSDLMTNTYFGTDNLIGPIVYVDDPDAVTLGKLICNRGIMLPGFCVKKFSDWTSIYIGAPMIPAQILRNIASFAGCHIYCDDLDVLYANKTFLCVHTNRSGERTIALPKKTDVLDIFRQRTVARKVSSFTDHIPAFSTVLYHLGEEFESKS